MQVLIWSALLITFGLAFYLVSGRKPEAPAQGGRRQIGPVTVTPVAATKGNTNDAAIDAVLAGWGLSRFQSYQVASHVVDGRLRIVLAEFEEAPVPVHIVHAEGRDLSARVRAFVDFAAERLRANPLIR